MTWTVNLGGHDDLAAGLKEDFENGLVERVRALVTDLVGEDGVNVTSASVTTNTTGSVDLLSNNEDAPVEASDETAAEPVPAEGGLVQSPDAGAETAPQVGTEPTDDTAADATGQATDDSATAETSGDQPTP